MRDYIKEMRDLRIYRDEKKKEELAELDTVGLARQKDLEKMKRSEEPQDIVKNLQEEMDQEKKDLESRLKYGGTESLTENERALIKVQ